MPESFSAFCKMVSFTAAKTRRMFEVSVACVRLFIVSSRNLEESHILLTEDIN
jgi:hypothetical protein